MTYDRLNRLELDILQLRATIAEQDSLILQLTRERDNARSIAVSLEQELASFHARDELAELMMNGEADDE